MIVGKKGDVGSRGGERMKSLKRGKDEQTRAEMFREDLDEGGGASVARSELQEGGTINYLWEKKTEEKIGKYYIGGGTSRIAYKINKKRRPERCFQDKGKEGPHEGKNKRTKQYFMRTQMGSWGAWEKTRAEEKSSLDEYDELQNSSLSSGLRLKEKRRKLLEKRYGRLYRNIHSEKKSSVLLDL